MSSTRPPIWVVLRGQFLAQPRKAAVLCVLFVVLVVVYLRLFLKDGATATAHAGPAAPLLTMPAPATVAVNPPVQRFQPDRPLVRELARDPFAVQLDRFAKDPDAVIAREPETTLPAARPAEDRTELRLQGTLCGPRKMAWINGRCLRAGEEVGGYVLEQIEPTRVTLTRDGVRRVLSME